MRAWPEIYVPQLSSKFSFAPLSLLNTATQRVEALPIKPLYRMYVCGITPYDATHLGHAATYLTFDLIHRYLKATGSEVRFVQNITDIDDPLLARAARDGIDWEVLANSQIDLFRSDMTNLHVLPPQHYVGVVEAMPLVIESILTLQESETTYTVENDLYFRIHSDAEFGTRSHYTDEQMLSIFAERGGDPTRAGKEDAFDALLWLAQREGEPGWPSPFGMGRPGWHIECTAIALEYLGTSITIQGGGSDLIFPHHEMCAAQGEVMNGQSFAKYFMHTGMIGYQGEKMSKSKGNLVFVSKLREAGIDSMAIRLALLANHYRSDREWDDLLLTNATKRLERWRKGFAKPEGPEIAQTISGVIDALNNDLDTTAALAHLDAWVEKAIADSSSDKDAKLANTGSLARFVDAVLGVAI